MEQSQRGVRKHHSMLVCCPDTLLIHDTSARGGQVFHTTLPRPMHVIGEREEGIARARSLVQLPPPLLPLFLAQRFRHTFEETLPACLLRPLEDLAADVEVNGIRLVCTLDTLFEGKRKNFRVVPEPPQVGLGPCQTGAMDTRLLTSSDTDDRSAVCVGNAIRLGVLQGKCGDDQVPHGVL